MSSEEEEEEWINLILLPFRIRWKVSSDIWKEKRRIREKHFPNPKLEIEIISSNDMRSEKHFQSTYEAVIAELMERKQRKENINRIKDSPSFVELLMKINFRNFPSKNIRCCTRRRNDDVILVYDESDSSRKRGGKIIEHRMKLGSSEIEKFMQTWMIR